MGYNLFSFLALIIKLKSNLLFGVQENFSSAILYTGEERRETFDL